MGLGTKWCLAATGLVVLASACASRAVLPEHPRANGTTLPLCTNASNWNSDEGATLRAFKKQMNSAYPNGQGAPGGVVSENAGDFAYPSLPQDITLVGSYTLDFGPLAANFNYPVSPDAVSFEFPPDFAGSIRPTGIPKIVTLDAQSFFEVGFQVSRLSAPCSGLVGWIY